MSVGSVILHMCFEYLNQWWLRRVRYRRKPSCRYSSTVPQNVPTHNYAHSTAKSGLFWIGLRHRVKMSVGLDLAPPILPHVELNEVHRM